MDLQGTAQLLGNFGEFFGAIAVLATLGYLVVQVKQNNKLLTATIYDSALDGYVDQNRVILESAEWASLAYRALTGQGALNEEEAFRFNMALRNFCNHVYKLYRLFKQGILPEEEWLNCAGNAVAVLSSDAGRAFRAGNPDFYRELFAELDKVESSQRLSFTLS